MHVVVVGGGVIGTTSAHALLEAGHEVTVVDRGRDGDGVATNVNAGLISPGHALAWASPAMLARLPAVLSNRTPQLRVRAHFDPHLVRWGMSFVRNCTAGRARRTSLLRAELGERSRVLLDRMIAEFAIDCGRAEGMLFVHTSDAALSQQFAAMQVLRDDGHDLRAVDRDGCLRLEPALAGADLAIAGAIHHPTGFTADSAAFTAALGRICREQGARLVSADVTGFESRGEQVVALVTDRGRIPADAVVVAGGVHTAALLGRSGRRLRLYPVAGLGLTWDGVPEELAPRLGGIDETNLVAWSRADGRLRVTGIAEFNRFSTRVHPADLHQVTQGAYRLFPWLTSLGRPRVGVGFRPMTADGLPKIGHWRGNVFVNAGHANLGWTMACGAAELLAASVAGQADGPLATAFAP
ncbi:MAG: FAD-dependent oxidoreductase [Actinobacteria bacterium]|jgi:D-amino-acid dehydrogenase|nr:FAD-dependent oxidoreductase [Actinomycetota bacterium]